MKIGAEKSKFPQNIDKIKAPQTPKQYGQPINLVKKQLWFVIRKPK